MDLPKPQTVAHKQAGVTSDNLTILLYGGTGSGKTCQLGELAEYYFAKFKLKTRLYSADPGGYDTIKAYVDLGIIDVVPFFGDAFLYLDKAVQGMKLVDGKWVPGISPDIGLYAFEGMTSLAEKLMDWMAAASAKGVNIGGGGAFNFVAGDSEKIKIGSSNMAHFGVAQQQVCSKAAQSQQLPGTVLWTAGDSYGQDDVSGGVVGPQIVGKSKTPEVPRSFKRTFHITTEVAPNAAPQHVLYLDGHIEMNAKMAKAIANARVPLAGSDAVTVPLKISPASLVQALELLTARQDAAKSAIAKRLGL